MALKDSSLPRKKYLEMMGFTKSGKTKVISYLTARTPRAVVLPHEMTVQEGCHFTGEHKHIQIRGEKALLSLRKLCVCYKHHFYLHSIGQNCGHMATPSCMTGWEM